MNKTQRQISAPRKFIRRALRLMLWSMLVVIMFGTGVAIGLSWIIHDTTSKLPEYEEIRQIPSGTSVRYFSSDMKLLHTTGPEYGEWLEYAEIPISMRKAIIAVEDRRFRNHLGVDPIALARAVKFAWDNYGTGRRLQGASTITQQVARTVFLDRRYDVRRKLDEMIVALSFERKFSKNEILELYLNKVYFGGGAYGIDAASRAFFGHDSRDLTLEEAAMLAGLVKAPSDYSPTADKEAAEGRMRVVLGLMKETGQAREVDTTASLPDLDLSKEREDRTGSRHFLDWLDPQIEQIAPNLSGKIDVYTTLDSEMQEHAQNAAETITPEGSQAALVSMEDGGAIRAMVGGRDYANSTYNRATQARRQPGSAFKLFVYLTALESGYGPNSRVYDGPVSIQGWEPKNSSGRYSGNLPLKTAFAYSLNTVAARMGQKLGTERIAQMAQRLGISTPINTDPSMVLGTAEVRLIDMTRAYGVVASGGLSVIPYGIDRIEQSGKPIFVRESSPRQIMIKKDVAASMTSLLRGVVEDGTASAASIGRPVAGKTGTTNSNKDGWFLGYSSGLVTGVWIGRDDAKPVAGLQGGRAPARLFSSYMSKAVQGRELGFETINPPRIAAPDMTMSRGEAIQGTSDTEAPSESIISATPSSPPPPMQMEIPPASRQGQSRAIRPDD